MAAAGVSGRRVGDQHLAPCGASSNLNSWPAEPPRFFSSSAVADSERVNLGSELVGARGSAAARAFGGEAASRWRPAEDAMRSGGGGSGAGDHVVASPSGAVLLLYNDMLNPTGGLARSYRDRPRTYRTRGELTNVLTGTL